MALKLTQAALKFAVAWLAVCGSAAIAQSGDPFRAQGDPQAALVGPLERATLVVEDAQTATQFFRDAMRMRLASETEPDESTAAAQRRLWNLPPSYRWRELRFDRPGAAGAVEVRVLVMRGGAPIRPDMQSRLLGGLSLGFPVANQRRLESRVKRLGVTSTAGITVLNMPRGDGGTYRVEEIHYRGPEGLYALGVWREQSLVPIGAIDAAAGLGGPAYSGIVVVNSDREIEFFQRALGWELRRDIELATSGPQGGLGLPEGTRYRFLQLFAPGAVTGYLVLLDFKDRNIANPVVPRMPNRGLVAWTFETRDLDAVLARIEAYPDGRATLLSRPLEVADSRGTSGAAAARRRVASVLTPNGLLLELVERQRP
jgi:catechol 2,3-dioxygenase-like lactoylglutathione lyase family enzyme